MKISEIDFVAAPVPPMLLPTRQRLDDETDPTLDAANKRVKDAQARKRAASQQNDLQVKQAQATRDALKAAQARKKALRAANLRTGR
jgi:hypothetical protein